MNQRDDLVQLKEDVKEIRENHIPHIQAELATFRAKLEWIEKILWTGITATVGSLVTGLLNLFK